MSITYSGPNNTTGLTTLAPGTGSTGFTSGRVPFANSSGQLTANSSGAYWDSTANRLGIGTATPAAEVSIHSTASTVGAKLRIEVHSNQADDVFQVFAGTSLKATIQGNGHFEASTGTTSGASYRSIDNNKLGMGFLTSNAGLLCANDPKFRFDTSGIGFFSATGTTQPSSYTTAAATTVRTLPTTVSTNTTNVTPWGFASSAQALTFFTEFNKLAGVVASIEKDLRTYGLFR